jgi:uncharacterized protein (DUF2141 family)
MMSAIRKFNPMSNGRRLSTATGQRSHAPYRLLAFWALISGIAGPVHGQALEPNRCVLQVRVSGLQSIQGQVVATLFWEGDDVFGPPRAKQTQVIVDGQASVSFENLQAGRYAVIVFHDINGNNTLDHNLLRFPAEPLGYSNGFELTLFSGLPSSRKLAVDVHPGATAINITVK